MASSLLKKLSAEIELLSLSDQLWLMERLAQQIRVQASAHVVSSEQDLAEMANDPSIRSELRDIAREFAVTEPDGLGLES